VQSNPHLLGTILREYNTKTIAVTPKKRAYVTWKRQRNLGAREPERARTTLFFANTILRSTKQEPRKKDARTA
jgi:hypothetical protein